MKAVVVLLSDTCTFERREHGVLVMRGPDKAPARRVVVRRMFPVSHPSELISVLDGEETEVGVIEDLAAFPHAVRKLIEDELDQHYFVPVITEVRSIKLEFGFFRWNTVTTAGEREFYVKGRTENIRRQGGNRLIITAVDNCRYEIPDFTRLSKPSLRVLDRVL
jgi:hypothetical protein